MCIKLVTGEDLIASVSRVGDTITITKPVGLMLVPQGEGNFGISFVPFLPFAQKPEFNLSVGSIVMTYEPSEQLRAQYTSVTSGLVAPTVEERRSLILS
jgi:hypothetical protein